MGDPGCGINVTFDETVRPEGYLPVVGELHHSTDCSYDRSDEIKAILLPNGKLAHGYTHTRYCTCRANLPQVTENHFNINCKWSRVKDTKYEIDEDQKVYIYRKCICQEPR